MRGPVIDTSASHDALAVCVLAGVPVLLWGSPGTGKTSVVTALGESLGWPVEVVIGSLREPSDFAGLPVVTDDEVRMAPPSWARRLATATDGLLFLDELTTAPPAVQAAMLRVVLERVVGDLRLPAGIRVVAAANPPEQAADGWDLSPPLANRLVHLDWTVSATSVATGFAQGFPTPAVIGKTGPTTARVTAGRALVAAFLQLRPELVLQVPASAHAASRGWPSPRSWETTARLLAACDHVGASPDVRRVLVTGAVGEGPGLELLAWLAHSDLPDPDQVLADPDSFELPARSDRA
ncbi:AAA family ATPase, partial [Actinophytocola sp.]|uniref:AAA family ATPase n=1 Tax=Actinophytocola sp. TaxID=1872138 RepID=UPI003899B884